MPVRSTAGKWISGCRPSRKSGKPRSDRKAGGNQEGSRTQESGGQGQTGSQDHKEGGDAEGRLETDDALNIRLETR
jgi:hypothetical protein